MNNHDSRSIHASDQSELSSATAAESPIAIIGLGCRFPGGVNDTEQFWELLTAGRDAVGPVPAERWDSRRFFAAEPGRPGKTQVREAGFLEQSIYQFDPLPFGISPREAEGLDPQQRLLLEVAWESLEDAGQDIARLRGSATGVFMGGFCLDTKLIKLSPLNRDQIDQHTAASITMTMLANRLSYIFDLRGPSLSLDTACSSSLVALHYACQSLLSGACDMALAGGVNVMLVPDYFIALSHARMLSPLARCMAFDERAAGYARGEGCGMVVLKPLAKALADGDSIRAVIHATGVNHDGRTPGITLPNTEAQVALMQEVYRKAKIRPGQVAYVEAHGTGTRAGDKAEVDALSRVMAEDRAADATCLVGAVKTNIGHLEAASGMAGLIKAVLVLEHRQVPPNLHLHVPNPDINWSDSCLRLPAAVLPLTSSPEDLDLPYAAVNSFGYGGTNAHVLLQAASSVVVLPDNEPNLIECDSPCLLAISACDTEALQALAGDYAKLLLAGQVPLADIIYSTATRRIHLPHRLAVVGNNRLALAEVLSDFSQGIDNGVGVFQAEAQPHKQGPVFVYSGMGPQWWGMGRELAECEPVFRDALEEVDALFYTQSGWSVLAAMGTDEASSRIAETAVAQPANLMLQVALTKLLAHWGIVPAAVVGHSIGEVAAAWSCGALSLADAVKVAFRRSQYQQTLAGTGGGMLAVGMTLDGASNLLRDYPEVAIAAINAPRSLTLSGPLSTLKIIAAELDRYEVFQRLLQVEIPYHSPAMDAICEPLLASLANISPQKSLLPWYSTVTGELQVLPCDAAYWWRNVREPVQFQATVDQLGEDGFQDFLEIGPHPVLQANLREILSRRTACWAAGTLHRKQPEAESLLMAAAALHVRGYALKWSAIIAPGALTKLPAYPWQRQHYWKESRRSLEDKQGRPGATWLWETLPAPFPAWQVDINQNFFPWLDEHRIGSRVVFPGAAYVAAALALQHQIYADTPCGLEDMVFHEMLVIEATQPRRLVSTLDRVAGLFHIYSYGIDQEDSVWRLHAEGYFRLGTLPPEIVIDLPALRERCDQVINVDDYYLSLAKLGLNYGPRFRTIGGLSTGSGVVLLELAAVEEPFVVDRLPPVILDALFQGLFAAIDKTDSQQRGMVPVAIAGLCIYAPLSGRLLAQLVLREQNIDNVVADMLFMNDQGCVLATVTGVRCKAISRPRQFMNPDWFHELTWQELTPSPFQKPASQGWLLLGTGILPTALAEQLNQQGQTCQAALLPLSDDLAAVRAAFYADYQALQCTLPPGIGARLLVFLDDPAAEADYATTYRHSLLTLGLAQVASQIIDEGNPMPVLCFITRMTQTVSSDAYTQNPWAAASWGLARVISNEIPGLVCRMVDLGNDTTPIEIELLQQHLSNAAVADEVAFRQGQIYQLQLIKSAETLMKVSPVLVDYSRHTPLVLDGWQPSNPRLFWREITLPKPSFPQVLVEVDSWLIESKVLAPPAVSGLEWHGTVRMIGEGITNFSVGQQVWGVRASPLETYMVVDKTDVWPIIRHEELPDMVLPLLQAWHSLAVQARLKKGETILLHNAEGPEALAWAEVAIRLKARLLVAIPEGEPRSVWEGLLDKDDVLDASRLDYREQLQALSTGVDVVVILNGTASPLADTSLLATGGRLLILTESLPEIVLGKLLAAGVQLLACKLEDFTRSAAAMAEAVAWLERQLAESWQPRFTLPRQALAELGFAVTGTRRYACLDLKTEKLIQALPADKTYCGLRRQASYLITGGTSGFGLSLALWLAGQGVAHLVLISRRGQVTAADQTLLDQLQKMSRVTVEAVDVTDANDVSVLYARLAQDELPLRGVFHCAMVLSDEWVLDIDEMNMDRVLRPKVEGALNLHHASYGLELDCFVLFSSVSALIGNPGQAAYAAANACLDSIAHWRVGLGLAGLSINWGVIGDVGVAAHEEGLLDHLKQTGMGSLDSTEALAALGVLLLNGVTQAGVFNMDWRRWRESALHWSARFQSLVTVDSAGGESAIDVLRRDMALLEPEARLDVLTRQLQRQLARILQQKEEHITVTQELSQFGLDSLMTLEWVVVIHQEWRLNVSAVELLKASSLTDLAGKLLLRVMK